MRLGSHDGAWCTEHNRTSFVTVSDTGNYSSYIGDQRDIGIPTIITKPHLSYRIGSLPCCYLQTFYFYFSDSPLDPSTQGSLILDISRKCLMWTFQEMISLCHLPIILGPRQSSFSWTVVSGIFVILFPKYPDLTDVGDFMSKMSGHGH